MRTAAISATCDPDLKANAYVWSFPGSPIQVHLNLDVVRRMEAKLKSGRSAVDTGDRGILLGRNLPGSPVITDFLPLQTADPAELETALAGLKSAADGARPVGYYRTGGQNRLRLSQDDLSLAQKHFSDPNNVFLLLCRLDALLPHTAGFFFWDEGQMNGDFCFLEFPFAPSLLATMEEGRPKTGGNRSSDVSVPAMVAPLATPLTSEIKTSWSSPNSRRSIRLVLAALVIAAVVFTSWMMLKRKTVRSDLGPSPIALKVKRQGTDLVVTWNQKSSRVTVTGTGRLIFHDGDSHREFPLDKNHLLSGDALYVPVSDHVRVQLDLIAPDHSITSESVMVVLQPPTTNPAEPPLSPNNSADSTSNQGRPALVGQKTRIDLMRPTRRFQPPTDQARTQLPPAADIQQPSLPGLADLKPSLPMTPPLIPAVIQPPVTLKPPAPRSLSTESPQTSAPAPTQPGSISDYVPPVPIRSISPTAFSAAQRSLLSNTAVTVDVKVYIDEFGKVRKAESLSHASPILVTAALSTARLWTFHPAQKGGRNVPGEMIIQFKFSPQK